MLAFIAVSAVMAISFGTMAAANNYIIVTPTNEQGFEKTVLAGGTVSFVADSAAPGNGALRLTTDSNPDSYAGYFKETNTRLADIRELSYYTKQNSGPTFADASFALGVNLTGTGGFTFLVYEPYLQTQPIVPGQFQVQDVTQGRIYSTETVTCANGTIQRGAPGDGPFYTLADVQRICPNAAVNVFGVFIGTSNLNYDVEVDQINFNGTIYDFEAGNGSPTGTPQSAAECKNGGYAGFTNPGFKNQGQCIKFVNSRRKTVVNR